MCFSASASFAASGVLSVVGAVSLTKAERNERLFAAVPLIFAAQQAIEGALWISPVESACQIGWGYGFLGFAYVVWPVYVPIAVYLMEKRPQQQGLERTTRGWG